MITLERILAGNGTANDFDTADWTLESRIGAALLQVGLSDLPLDRRLRTLSGGERMRVGIVHLVIEAPDLLLLDEPTNNLDVAGRAAIRGLMRDWSGGVVDWRFPRFHRPGGCTSRDRHLRQSDDDRSAFSAPCIRLHQSAREQMGGGLLLAGYVAYVFLIWP